MPPSLTLRDGARGFLFSSGAPVAGVVVEALGRALCSGCSVSVMEGSAAALREALLRRLVARAEWDIVHSAAVSACFPSANQRDLGTGAAQCVSTSGVRRSLAGSAGGLHGRGAPCGPRGVLAWTTTGPRDGANEHHERQAAPKTRNHGASSPYTTYKMKNKDLPPDNEKTGKPVAFSRRQTYFFPSILSRQRPN